MLLVGLTGGIGSGKTTVAQMLRARGAIVIDADELARRAIDPGTAGFEQLIREFGAGSVLTPSGDVDRQALGRLVFADDEARHRLESIVHPEVTRMFRAALELYRDTPSVVVYAVPLLAERGLQGAFDLVVVVEAPKDVRVDRLVKDPGRRMSAADVRARMAAQASDEDRDRLADLVVANDGSLDDLKRGVDALWRDLSERAGIIESR